MAQLSLKFAFCVEASPCLDIIEQKHCILSKCVVSDVCHR